MCTCITQVSFVYDVASPKKRHIILQVSNRVQDQKRKKFGKQLNDKNSESEQLVAKHDNQRRILTWRLQK